MTLQTILDAARCNAEASARQGNTHPTHFRSAAGQSVSARLAGTNSVEPTATQLARIGITDLRARKHLFRDLPVRDRGGASSTARPATAPATPPKPSPSPTSIIAGDWGPAKSAAGGEPARILVVDDDPVTSRMVVDYLENRNMRAISASERQEMTRLLAVGEPSLVLLDLCLGRDTGLELLQEIRSRSDVPVIMTTDPRSDESDRVVGLELGADDCVTKPFGLRELAARIRAVLRRREVTHAAPRRDREASRCRFGGWELNRRTRRLTDPNGAPVALTKGEYTVLIAFLDAPLRPLSREYLLQATRLHEDIFDRSVDVQILRLRRKLEIDPSAPNIIRTERSVGYVFALPVESL
jgi:two-component system, OmpR family, response regulator